MKLWVMTASVTWRKGSNSWLVMTITMVLFIHCFSLYPILLSGEVAYVGYYFID